MELEALFEEFIRERRLLKNISRKTEIYYQQGFNAYKRYAPAEPQPNKTQLSKWVMAMREANVKPVSCNTYISAMNAFWNWLYENEVMDKRLKVDPMKLPDDGLKIISEAQLNIIINYKPKNKPEWRIHAFLSLLIDTGLRIDEALGALLDKVDFEQSLLIVMGKGNKERTVPMSFEMRRRLWLYVKRYREKAPSLYVFPSQNGGRIDYNNMRRDILKLCQQLNVKGRVNPHSFRHYFAINFLRRGGDLYRLSRILGHTSIATTQIYLT
jgi:integrase/recombinase XerD